MQAPLETVDFWRECSKKTVKSGEALHNDLRHKMSLCHCRTVEGYFFVAFLRELPQCGGIDMPKTKAQSVFFTAVTAWIMVYIMTLYNTGTGIWCVYQRDASDCAEGHVGGVPDYLFVCLFPVQPGCKVPCLSGGKAGRSTHCDHSDHSGIYGGVLGGAGQRRWAISWLRL